MKMRERVERECDAPIWVTRGKNIRCNVWKVVAHWMVQVNLPGNGAESVE